MTPTVEIAMTQAPVEARTRSLEGPWKVVYGPPVFEFGSEYLRAVGLDPRKYRPGLFGLRLDRPRNIPRGRGRLRRWRSL
jgi:hypothetical protein